MKNKRPVSLIILGIVFIIMGLLSLVSIFWVPGALKTTLIQFYWILWSSLFLITGFGILSLKQWARILALVLVTIKTIQVFVGSVKDTRTLINISPDSIVIYFGIGLTVLVLVIGCGVIYYLASPKTKEQFK